jgi:hypothetical protein
MKVAPLIFCAALGIFLTTIAVSKRIPVEVSKATQVLDFTGIDTLEIRSEDTAKISIRDDAATLLSDGAAYDYYEGGNSVARFSVNISGSKMLILADQMRYRDFTVVMPSSVKKLQVRNASINTNAGIEDLSVRVSKSLQWEGNANRVQIVDMRDYADPEVKCMSNIEIKSGAIVDLLIQTGNGMVKLDALDQIKTTTLRVGPKASLLISPVSSMKNIQFREFNPPAMPETAHSKTSGEDVFGCLDI